MKVDFKIDDNYLIVHTLANHGENRFSSGKFKKDIVNFQNMAWEKSKESYSLLTGSPFPGAVSSKEIKNLSAFIEYLKNTKEYAQIYQQSLDYRNWIDKKWQANFKKTLAIMEGITGLHFDKPFTVYITHPSLRNGKNWGDNIITWGCNEKWTNYSVVYLWHEILHSYLDHSDKSHAVIELATDNELRARLNGDKYPPFEGHMNLLALKKKMLPRWRKYLKLTQKDIRGFK